MRLRRSSEAIVCVTQHNTKLFASAFANLNIQMYAN